MNQQVEFILGIISSIVITYFIEVYFIKRVTAALKLGFPFLTGKKIGWIKKSFIILLNIFPIYGLIYWTYIHYSSVADMEFPQNKLFDILMLYPFSFAVVTILQATIFIVLVDLIWRLIPYIKKIAVFLERIELKKLKVYEARMVIGSLIFCVIYVPYKIHYDVNTIAIRQVQYTSDNLPASVHDFKIAFISDIQVDRYTSIAKLDKMVDKVNSTNPDLILIAGDLITCSPQYIGLSANYLGRLHSKYGVYSCVGDHDNWAYTYDNKRSIRELSDALNLSQVKLIDNGRLQINAGSFKISITFITNTYIEIIKSHILNSLTSCPDSSNLKILLTHQPQKYIIDKAVENNYNLFLAGHTHGGQFTFLFPFYNLTPTRFETKYVKGDFWFGKTLAVVTRGLGMSLFPVRYNSTGEVTLINIRSNKL
jgi:uncharacterized protein